MKITMKRIYSFIAAALTIISAASCVQELANGPQHQEGAVVYKAIAEGTDSKAVLGTNESGRPQSMWEKGDKITIHNGERGYEFTTSSDDYSPVADFVYNGDGISAENGVIAVYPAGNYDADIEARSVMVTIPSHQQAVENSYDRNAVPAVAYSTDNSLHFYNAGGLLKFTMNQMNVTKVRFSSNESVVTGSYYAICRSALSDGPGFHFNYISDVPEYNINYAELYAPEGDTFQSDRTYYLSIIPGTLESGFILEFFDANGTVIYTKDYDRSITIKRNVILDMGTLGEGSSEKLADYIDEYGINHGPGVEIDGVVWAPVNCGYHETDFKYGKLYQWGRKFGQGYDCPWDKTYVDASVPEKVQGYVDLVTGQSEANADKFYYGYMLIWHNIPYDNLWNLGTQNNPVKTEYDPCPEGWRVPTASELDALRNNSSSWTASDDQNGYWFSGLTSYASEVSQVFFPAAGYRRNDTSDGVDRSRGGYYWSSQDYGYCFYSSFSSTFNLSGLGASVRCVQDDSELIPVAGLTLNTSSLMMHPGTGRDIYASIAPSNANHQSIYWSSSNTSVATVDMNGTVTAVSPGTATITAMAGMKTATCEVTVSEEAPSDDYIDEYGINHGPGVEIDGVVWAPVNCGYHAEDFKYGKLYQWGRKYGQGYEGPLYENGENVGTYSDATVPIIEGGGVSITTGNHKSQENVFYTSTSEYNYDWVYPQDDKLWNSGTESKPVKTDYDPCPSGWRVPTNAELYELTNNYSEWIANSEGQYGRWFSGASQYDERVPRIFLPAAGRLQHSYNADARGDRGLYWSSQPYINSASNVISTTTYVNNIDNSRRARGCSVRCVQDDSSYEPGNGGSQSGDIEDMPEIELF